MKKAEFWNTYPKFSQIKSIKKVTFVSKSKINSTVVNNFLTYFSKICEISRKISVKNKNKKILITNSKLDGLSNDTTQNSLRWMYRSVKIVSTKKDPLRRGRNNNNLLLLNLLNDKTMCIVEPITEDTCSYFHLLTTKMQNEQHEFNVNWNKKIVIWI